MIERVVLISALDWGLGHAARCLPLINSYKKKGAKVIISGSGKSGEWLHNKFPEEQYIALPGIEINYKLNNSGLLFSVLKQIPALIKNIKSENRVISELIKTNSVDLIISDNRYGVYNKNVKSILITHQLNIRSGSRTLLLDKIATRLIQNYFTNFDEIWVPDFEGPLNLSGDLSHGKMHFKDKIKYIGPLSRFKHESIIDKDVKEVFEQKSMFPNNESSNPVTPNNQKVLALLSGPEPTRTEFESELIEIFSKSKLQLDLVRGTLTKNPHQTVPANIRIINFAEDVQIKKLREENTVCIMRSGYSSLMDHYYLGGKIILIPTPGQGEQEYLASYWNKNYDVPVINQSELKSNLVPQINEIHKKSFH